MTKKQEACTPDPKSADYKSKEAAIARVNPKNPPEKVELALSDMGAAIAANPVLSNSQQDKFVQALVTTGLLTYKSTYLERIGEIDKQTTSLVERERLEAEQKLTLDAVAWDIETKGALQAQAVSTAWQLSQPQVRTREKIEIIAQLINIGHLATKKDSLFAAPYDSLGFQTAITHAEGIENTIFGKRSEYAAELMPLGLFEPDQDWELSDMTIDDFRVSSSYDSMLALHFLHQLTGQTVRDRFVGLQPVLHFGYSIGVRDANQAKARN